MGERIRAVPEDLHVSAGKVEMHADELQLRHFASNGRIEAVQGGVPAAAAVALSGVVAKWQVDTTVLFGKLAEHGEAMHGAATGYVEHDERSAANIEAVGVQGSSLAADL